MRLFVVASLVLVASVAAADDPIELNSREGRFSATFPADPVKSTNKVMIKGGGEIAMTRYTAEFKKRSFSIVFNDYAPGPQPPKPQDVLKGVRDGNVGDGTLGDEKIGDFGKQKLPMRAFTFTRNKLHYRNLIVLDENRLYQVMVSAEAEDGLTDETAEAFYKAFQIHAAPAPAIPGKPRDAFVDKVGRFSILFPGEPKEQKTMVPLAGTDKKITINSQVLEVGKTTAFLAAYNDYPAGVLSPDAQDVLQGVRDGNLGPEGKLVDEKKGTFGPKKLPMREFTFVKSGIHTRNRIILDGTRLYQVMMVAEDEKSLTNETAKKYFDSFKILPLED